MKTIILTYFVILYATSGVTSHSLTKTNQFEMPENNLDCKTCTLIVEKIESNLDVDYFSHLEEVKNIVEKFSPFCNTLRRIKPDINCNLLDQFPNSKEFTCGYLTNYCSNDFESIFVKTSNNSDICETCLMNVEQILKDIQKGLENILEYYEDHVIPAMNQYCALYGPDLSEVCLDILDQLSQIILVPVLWLLLVIGINMDYYPQEICESLLFCA